MNDLCGKTYSILLNALDLKPLIIMEHPDVVPSNASSLEKAFLVIEIIGFPQKFLQC